VSKQTRAHFEVESGWLSPTPVVVRWKGKAKPCENCETLGAKDREFEEANPPNQMFAAYLELPGFGWVTERRELRLYMGAVERPPPPYQDSGLRPP
jgi:hypothetical protein